MGSQGLEYSREVSFLGSGVPPVGSEVFEYVEDFGDEEDCTYEQFSTSVYRECLKRAEGSQLTMVGRFVEGCVRTNHGVHPKHKQ